MGEPMNVSLANWFFSEEMDKRGLRPNVKGVLATYAFKAYDDGRIPISAAKAAKIYGIDKSNSLEATRELVSLGYVVREGNALRFSNRIMAEVRSLSEWEGNSPSEGDSPSEGVSPSRGGQNALGGRVICPRGEGETTTPDTKLVPPEGAVPSSLSSPLTPITHSISYIPTSDTPPKAPPRGRGTAGTESPKDESLEAVLAETKRRWMEEHKGAAESADASACHGNGPSSSSQGAGATTLPADAETHASVAPNGQSSRELYRHPDNWVEPEPEPSLFPEDEVAPVPKPAPEPKAKPKPKYTERFEEWWKAYPPVRRTGKPQCFAKWKSAIASGVTEEELFLGLARWINSRDWQKDDGQYACAPQVWLNQERWNDTPLPAQTRVRELGGFQVPNVQCVAHQSMAQVSAQEEYSTEEKAFLKIWCKHPSDVALFHRLFAETTAEITCEELNECAASFVKQLRDTEGSIAKLRRPEAYLQDRLWTDDIDYAKALIFHRLPEEEQMRLLREQRRNGRKAI